MTKELEKLALDLLAQGKKICVGEYRLCDADTINYQSTKTGKAESFAGVWHTVEVGDESIKVQDRSDAVLALKADIGGYKTPFKKGSMVCVEILSSGYVKGSGERHTGIIHAVGETTTVKL